MINIHKGALFEKRLVVANCLDNTIMSCVCARPASRSVRSQAASRYCWAECLWQLELLKDYRSPAIVIDIDKDLKLLTRSLDL